MVIDASVVVAALLPEVHTEGADALSRQVRAAAMQVIGPPLLPIEVTHTIYPRGRRGDPTLLRADETLQSFEWFSIVPLPVEVLHERAFAFASEHGLPNILDCSYVVLAEREGAELWTADARLLRAMTGVAPWVRWIGDVQTG